MNIDIGIECQDKMPQTIRQKNSEQSRKRFSLSFVSSRLSPMKIVLTVDELLSCLVGIPEILRG